MMLCTQQHAAKERRSVRCKISNNSGQLGRKILHVVCSLLALFIFGSMELACAEFDCSEVKKCPIVSVLPFNQYGKPTKQLQRSPEIPLGQMAAAYMATKHFNEKNPTVVPELGTDEYKDCKVELPLYKDISFLAALRHDDGILRTKDAILNPNIAGEDLCGIIGPYTYKTIPGTAAMAVAFQTPLISYHTTDFVTGRNHLRPLTVAITPEIDEKAQMMLEYIMKHRGRNYVALVYNVIDLPHVAEGFVEAAHEMNKNEDGTIYEFKTFPVVVNDDNDYVKFVQELKEMGWKTVIGAFSRLDQWEKLFLQLEEQNLSSADNDFVWYSFESSELGEFAVDNKQWKAREEKTPMLYEARANVLGGAGSFQVLNGFEDNPVCDDNNTDKDGPHRFLCAWKNMTSEDVETLIDLHPVPNFSKKKPGLLKPKNDYFQSKNPSAHSAMVYDSVIALGMAKCRSCLPTTYNSRRPPGQPRLPIYPWTNSDVRLYDELAVNTTFKGASGDVILHNEQFYTRPASTVSFGIYNIRRKEGKFVNETSFEYKLTAMKKPGKDWMDLEDFVYADGTNVEPKNYVPPKDEFPVWAIVVLSCVGCLTLLGVTAIVFKRRPDDSIWMVKRSDLKFDEPPKVLGTGSFGLVLLAEYRGTQVATKQILPSQLDSKKSDKGEECADVESGPGKDSLLTLDTYDSNKSDKKSLKSQKLRQDFILEMRHLSKLRHPCITTLMGAVMDKGEEPMLVMEYMEYGSLYDLLRNISFVLEGDSVLPLLRDISQGIRFLHAASPAVIHGDLKARNVLVDSRFRAKVTDFGMSHNNGTAAGGTPYWMAPELLRHESQSNAATDVYAFGILLYEIYARKDPYEDEDLDDVLKLVADPRINKRPPLPPSCPPQIQAMMSDCIEGNPEFRPTMKELDMRLKRLNADTAEPGHIGMSNQMEKTERRLSASEHLLKDVFPPHIAEALQEGRKVEPESKEVVTIFFSDIVGFTNISSTLPPIKVSQMLDRLYNKFDSLSRKHDVFKVETIGDAYMAVTNLVKDQSTNHAKQIAEFSIAALQAANETLVDEEDESKGHVNIRVGFHSGPVVANVVGSRNPRYCLFGDTVNTASRMESNSIKNRIHCSESAVDILRVQSTGIPITSRGVINVKGKGEMHTYWVNE